MKRRAFENKPLSVCGREVFEEASAEELRVLLALIEAGYEASEVELAKAAKVSRARCAAALTLWQEAGVLVPRAEEKAAPRGDGDVLLTDARESRLSAGEIAEESGGEIAREIREKKLASLLEECAALMKKTTLSAADVRQITSLAAQYALDEEYIATLAAHMAEHGKLTATLLVNRAIKLSDRGIRTVEDLTAFLAESERQNEDLMRVRRILGIYGRALTKSEETAFLRWTREFGYSDDVVGEAYDITVTNTGRAAVSYMNALLAAWHKAGCTTVEQIRLLRAKESIERENGAEKAAARAAAAKPRRGAREEKPRYADFDPEEMMNRAIERSFAASAARMAEGENEKP